MDKIILQEALKRLKKINESKPTWADKKYDDLMSKSTDSWDDDDWDAYNYIMNAWGETSYYDDEPNWPAEDFDFYDESLTEAKNDFRVNLKTLIYDYIKHYQPQEPQLRRIPKDMTFRDVYDNLIAGKRNLISNNIDSAVVSSILIALSKIIGNKRFGQVYNNWVRNHANESLTEADTLAKPFKKDIKRDYKRFDTRRDKANKEADEIRQMFSDSDVNSEILDDFINDKVYKGVKNKFNYKFPRNIERKSFPYYVTYYEEYPIYEPAEGGYYYPGVKAVASYGYNSKQEAIDDLDRLADEFEFENIKKYVNGIQDYSKYIGNSRHLIVEPEKSYLSSESGWKPYE